MSDPVGPPWYYWVVAAAGFLLFLGPAVSSLRTFIWPELLAGMAEPYRSFIQAGPTWWRLAFVISTVSAAAGCLSLLLRHAVATPLFLMSLGGSATYFFYEYVMVDVISVFGADAVFEPLIVFSLLAALIWFSRHSSHRGYLRVRTRDETAEA